MRIRNIRSRTGRGGFTLIELLVVIAIIAVLTGLLMAGVMAALQAKDRRANQFDIGKLSQATQVANQKYGTKTLPGKLVLCNNMGAYNAAPPAGVTAQELAYSKDVLRAMFGSRLLERDTSGAYNVVPWDGTNNNSVCVLEGTQCLVFYLGGMPVTQNGVIKMTGFSSNPRNPAASGVEDRIGPFYEFESSRLSRAWSSQSAIPGNWCPVYLDRYGSPYAYFGGTGGSNTYKSYCPSLGPICPNSATNGPLAYQESTSPLRWTRPDTFQIISAGKDKRFGAGGVWNPTTGVTNDGNARDDVSNFSSTALTNPQN